MKNIFLITFLAFAMAACSKTEEPADTICSTEINCSSENCLFALDSQVGTTSFLSCYEKWAIKVPTDAEVNWYIVDYWDTSYKQEGIDVTFCGYVRENTLPLILPDPMGGRIYQIRLENIEVNTAQ